jgi:hypothetical protein
LFNEKALGLGESGDAVMDKLHAARHRMGALLMAMAVVGLAAAACAPQAAPTPGPPLTPAEETYLELHKAIAAYQRCSDVEFTQPQRQALETRVQRMAGEQLGAGTMLSLIERAETEMASRVTTQGCRTPAVAPYVARFEDDLAGAAGL